MRHPGLGRGQKLEFELTFDQTSRRQKVEVRVNSDFNSPQGQKVGDGVHSEFQLGFDAWLRQVSV